MLAPARPLAQRPRLRLLGALLALAGAAACAERAAAPAELVVYAAASTRDALRALEADYEREHDLELVFNFGSSGALSRQILAAAQADVFLSADEREMERVREGGLVLEGTQRALLANQLVVIVPADEPSPWHQPFEPRQLAGEGVRLLSLAEVETVPAGRYAKAWLASRGLWDELAARVLPGVDVRAALAAVAAGGAQAGIVYRTDAARSREVRVAYAVPLEEGPRIVYPVAVMAGRAHEQRARAFVAFLSSPAARAAFEREGFGVLP